MRAMFSNFRKDVLVLALIVLVLGVALIAIAHTLQVAIFFGSILLAQLLLPLIACVAAVSVIVQKNAINSLLSLMGLFIASAAMYLIAGAGYFALVFLLIGQGAVAILFLYAVILLPLRAVQSNESFLKHNSQVAALVTGIAGFVIMITELYSAFSDFFNQQVTSSVSSESLRHYVNEEANDIFAFASLYSDKTALFLLITAVLLSAMIGSIVLATSTVSKNLTGVNLIPMITLPVLNIDPNLICLDANSSETFFIDYPYVTLQLLPC